MTANFDRDLADQLRDPGLAKRFKRAGEAWDVALQIAAVREQAGLSQQELADLLPTSHLPAADQPARIARLRRPLPQHAAPRGSGVKSPGPGRDRTGVRTAAGGGGPGAHGSKRSARKTA